MSFGIDVALAWSGQNRGLYFFSDGLGKFLGERERLIEVAVVTLGPDVSVGGSVDQLHRHVYTIGIT